MAHHALDVFLMGLAILVKLFLETLNVGLEVGPLLHKLLLLVHAVGLLLLGVVHLDVGAVETDH